MARRRFTSGRGQRLSRRWLEWSTGSGFFNQAAGTRGVSLASATTLKDTIMRTRVNLTCSVDGAVGTAIAAEISVGMWIVPEGTATTVLADPFSDGNADWFYYSSFLIAYEETVVDVLAVPAISGYREIIDVKAMRIGDSDTEIQAVVTNTTISGAMNINLHMAGRFLLGR